MIIIGSKGYKNINLNNIIDTFDKNLRFNMSLPYHNNGTKCDELLCNNHVYKFLQKNQISRSELIRTYSRLLEKDYIDFFAKNYRKSRFSRIYNRIQPNANNEMPSLTDFLHKLKCPIQCPANNYFRTGLEGILHNINKTNKPTLVGFSIVYSSIIKTIGKKPKKSLHPIKEEAEIIKWLHNNNYVDATLCCLEDTMPPTLECKDIKPSRQIINLLIKEYGVCNFKNYPKKTLNKVIKEKN